MSDQGIWFKLWCAALDDPDLDNLTLENWARWAKLGAYIKKHGESGKLTVSQPAQALCGFLKCVTFDDAMLCISMLPNVTVTCVTNTTVTHEIVWENWFRFQGDNSLDRVRKFRAKKRESVTAKKRREEKRITTYAPTEKSEPPKAVIVFAGKAMQVTASDHQKLVSVYDEKLALSEYPKADLWMQNNPQRKRKMIARFMASWLERASRTAPKGGGSHSVGPNYF